MSIEPIDPLRIYRAAEVSRLLFGRGVQWFYKNRPELHRRERFPLPIYPVGQPRWNGHLLLAWAQRPPDAPRRVADGILRRRGDIAAELDARATLIAAEGQERRDRRKRSRAQSSS